MNNNKDCPVGQLNSNILDNVCHMFHSEMLNTSTHKFCQLNSTGRDLGAVSEEPKEDFGVNRYISGRSFLLTFISQKSFLIHPST